MVHALREVHRVLAHGGILVDARPDSRVFAYAERRKARGFQRFGLVSTSRLEHANDRASDRAIARVVRETLFELSCLSGRPILSRPSTVFDLLPACTTGSQLRPGHRPNSPEPKPPDQNWWMGGTTGVPLRLSSFIGRKKEMGELRRLLVHTRLLTMLGPGGAGKTRLATEFAWA